MKKLLLIAALFVADYSWAQTASCCKVHASVTEKNAILAMNEDFAKSHAEPLPYLLDDHKGAMIEFQTAEGKVAKGYLVKAAKTSKKYIFVFHEWWGLNDYIKRESDKLSADLKDVNVLAIDLYDGNVADNREDAQKYMSGLTEKRMFAIINGAFAFAGKSAKIATIGWCSGGSWSLQAAIAGEKSVKACVMYYGTPEMDVAKLKKLKTDVLGIFAEKDNHISVELVKSFELKMKEAGKKIVVYNYVADHAFANPSNPDYNKEAAEDAYTMRVLPFLKNKMKIK